MSIQELLKRGALGGLAFGLAVSAVHLTVGVGLILALNTPPMTAFVAKSIPMEVTVAVLAGALFSWVHLLPRGAWAHPLAMGLVWLGLERWVAVDPTRLEMWVAPTVVGLVVLGLATAVFRRLPWLVVGAVPLYLGGLIAAPVISYQLGDYGPKPDPDRKAPPPGSPDVVFIVMDTVRAKSVSAYGYDRDTTPNFDAFAKEGVLFTNAQSPSTWSLPAHASLFTGHFPSSHEGHDETRFLDTRLPTIASTLAERGWQTMAFSANPYISDTFGLTRGFDYTDQAWKSGEGGRQFSFVYRLVDKVGFAAEDKGGAAVVENITRWMADRPKDAPPAFVFVNFLEAHFPFQQLPREYLRAYTQAPYAELAEASQTAFGVQFGRQLTPEEEGRIRQPLLDMYDGGVKYTDALAGEVVDLWRARGTLDDTVFVILGDHGEMMGEHGAFGHVTSLYQPDLHVPYAIRYPRALPAAVVEAPTSTLTVFPTILDLLGQEPLHPLQARSIRSDQRTPLISERFEEKMLASRFAPGTANGRGPILQPRGRYRVCREGPWKYVQHAIDGRIDEFLFDLSTDPGEETDVAATNPVKLTGMKEEICASQFNLLGMPPLDAPVGTKAEVKKMSAEECEQLKALGYVDPDTDCNAQ